MKYVKLVKRLKCQTVNSSFILMLLGSMVITQFINLQKNNYVFTVFIHRRLKTFV